MIVAGALQSGMLEEMFEEQMRAEQQVLEEDCEKSYQSPQEWICSNHIELAMLESKKYSLSAYALFVVFSAVSHCG